MNYNSKITFRVSLSDIHKFFEIEPFISQDKKIELGESRTTLPKITHFSLRIQEESHRREEEAELLLR